MTGTRVEVLVEAHAGCGESPTWDARTRRLVWVDQHVGLVHWCDPATGRTASLDVGQPVGAVAPREQGGFVLALADGFWLLEPDDTSLTRLAAVEEDVPDHMMNDGKCDRRGRFWAGTLAMDEKDPVGSLYRLEPRGGVTRVLTGITVSNGLGWSPDGRTFYHIDSALRRVDAWSFEPETGAISNRRVLLSMSPGDGGPDGLAVDSEGHLWVALWDGHALRRYSPRGRPETQIDLPVSRVTSCAFGGADLGDLYITSASIGLAPEVLAREPHAGAVFVTRPGVRGLPTDTFRG